MKLAWKLAAAYAWRHPARMLLTSLAMVASACVVVWVVSGYDALASKFGDTASEYLGRYDLFVMPDSLKEEYLPAELISEMRQDAAVAESEPVLQAVVTARSDAISGPGMGGPGRGGPGRGGQGMGGSGSGPTGAGPRSPAEKGPGAANAGQGPGGPGGPGRPGGPGGRPGMMGGAPNLVGTTAEKPPYKLAEGRWIAYGNPALRETVVSNILAEQLQLKLNDDVMVICGTKEFHLKVVGITKQAAIQPLSGGTVPDSPTGRPMMQMRQGPSMGPAAAALYVPMPLAEKIAKRQDKVNLVSIKLKIASDAEEFRARWIAKAAKSTPPVLIAGTQELKTAQEMGMMAANAKKQAWAATGMSLLAALFIIFTTLSMGVHERVRQFAMMRAVGLTRRQIAAVIASESVLLAFIGWGGGLVAGWLLLAVFRSNKPDLFGNTASLGWWCIVLTGASAFGGALIASLVPAWQATSVKPLEAMSPRRSARPSAKFITQMAIVGLVAIAANPLLVYVAPIPDAARYGIYDGVGCTTMAVGFLLLAPLAIVLTEKIFGPVFARLLGVEPKLLASQLSSNLWRTLGTTVALTVGLGLYVAMMVWGYSMLQPFKPGDWVPDLLAAFQMGGLPDEEIQALRQVKGVIAEQCIPLAVDQPRLAGDITGSNEGNSVTRQDNVIMIGLDPDVAFGGAKPLIGAKFVEGSATDAVAKLKQGRYCIVPDHFLAATGLRLGGKFSMIPPERPDKPVEYTIAGAVSLPGWHWMTKFSGLRRRSGRSAAMVFANYEDVRRDFNLKQLNFFWMNIDKQKYTIDQIGQAMQPIADRNLGDRQPVNGQGAWAVGAQMFGQSLRISTPEEVSTRILARADDMIWAMCELPLITLLVTALGVVNTIMASVRARRWEFGVLRSVGVTRGAMARVILAEGLLIGIVACLLSLAFGVMAGWCGTGISQYVSFFGGMETPLFIPWAKLTAGIATTLLLCLLAALWPAFTTARAEPLKLLQEGRTAL
jgi:putative ABC transport system permease protein